MSLLLSVKRTMNVHKKIQAMIWKAKKAYDDMLRDNTFSSGRLEEVFSGLSENEVPIDSKKYRVPGTIPIFVFNLCFYHDDYYQNYYNQTSGYIPVYQVSGTLFPNHAQPLYEITTILISEATIKIAELVQTVEVTAESNNPQKDTKDAIMKKMPSIRKHKLPSGVETELIQITVLESIEKIPVYNFHSSKRKFTAPDRQNTPKEQLTKVSERGRFTYTTKSTVV